MFARILICCALFGWPNLVIAQSVPQDTALRDLQAIRVQAERIAETAATSIRAGKRLASLHVAEDKTLQRVEEAKRQLEEAEALLRDIDEASEIVIGGPSVLPSETKDLTDKLRTRTANLAVETSSTWADTGGLAAYVLSTAWGTKQQASAPTDDSEKRADAIIATLDPAKAAKDGCVVDATCTPVRVFFGTDRTMQPGATRIQFSADRSQKLQLGTATVTVPRAHRKAGDVNRPSWWDLLKLRNPWREDASIHFTVPDNGINLYSSSDEFLAAVRQHMPDAGDFKDHAFVFVHGFNVSFDDALYRTAQISYDLGDGDTPFGTAFLYSWPSKGVVQDYVYDGDSARFAREHLGKFLDLVLAQGGAKKIHLIAHSMGNEPLLDLLAERAKVHKGPKQITEVVLAAPDVDAGQFPKIAAQIASVAGGVTLYASSNDRAMFASRKVHANAPRAGDVRGEAPVLVAGVESIDVSRLNTDIFSLNHSTYADSGALLTDIWRLMRLSERPPNVRSLPFKPRGTKEAPYWRYEE